jgi:hypothetical protein
VPARRLTTKTGQASNVSADRARVVPPRADASRMPRLAHLPGIS